MLTLFIISPTKDSEKTHPCKAWMLVGFNKARIPVYLNAPGISFDWVNKTFRHLLGFPQIEMVRENQEMLWLRCIETTKWNIFLQ